MAEERIREWSGTDGEESWTLEVETDCFKEGAPFVVSLWTEYDEGLGRDAEKTLVCASPEQARQIATALIAEADCAEQNTARVEKYRPSEKGNQDG
jgi:hypothetical protein